MTPNTSHGFTPEFQFFLGSKAVKDSGDYTFEGTVVGIVTKLSGQTRIVLEDSRGLLFIFNPSQLRRIQ